MAGGWVCTTSQEPAAPDPLLVMEAVRLRVENERAEIQVRLGAQILTALALRELAGQMGKIDHLTITPELVTPLLQRLAEPKES